MVPFGKAIFFHYVHNYNYMRMRVTYDERIRYTDCFVYTGLNVCVIIRGQLILYGIRLEQRANELMNKRHG